MRSGRGIYVSAVVVAVALAFVAVATAQDPVQVAPQAFTQKIDNDSVRVLEYKSKPGDKEAMHAHGAAVIHSMNDCKLRYTFADGKVSEQEIKAGDVLWREGVTHSVENVGTTECHALLVEVKAAKK